MRFGSFAVDHARRQLTRGGKEVHLTPKAFDLLACLISEAPRVVPKAELHDRLWAGTFVTDATIVGVVKELRRALADEDHVSPIIRTAHRVGYAFCAPLDSGIPAAQGITHWVVVQGRRMILENGENILGRDQTAAVQVDSAGVSRRHARIVVGEGMVILEDLGSKNGTWLGDVRLTAAAMLKDGDHIRVGSAPLVYRASQSGMSTETQVAAVEAPGAGSRSPDS